MSTSSQDWQVCVQRIKDLEAPDPRTSIGMICDFVPPELIHAAGLTPARLIHRADQHAVSQGNTYLQRNACPFVRGCMGEIAQKEYADYYGLVLSHTCDSMRGLAENVEYFRLHPGLLYVLDLPRNATTRSAFTYYLTQLTELKSTIESDRTITISEEKLIASTRLYNELKLQLRQLRRCIDRLGATISMTHFYDVLYAAMTRSPDTLLPRLRDLVHCLESLPANSDRRPIRLMLTGSLLPHGDPGAEESGVEKLLFLVEQLGAQVVDDFLCSGSQLVEPPVETGDNMLERLATACFQQVSCSWMFPHDGRDEQLLERIRSQGVQGLVHYTLKFCDTLQYDAPRIRQLCQGAGIPFLALETEMTDFDRGQTTTRIQAFLEGIKLCSSSAMASAD